MRRLLIQIPAEDYRKLQHLAARDERNPDRQAAWLLRDRLARVKLPAEQGQLVEAVRPEREPAEAAR
jgi:hypothetical protein